MLLTTSLMCAVASERTDFNAQIGQFCGRDDIHQSDVEQRSCLPFCPAGFPRLSEGVIGIFLPSRPKPAALGCEAKKSPAKWCGVPVCVAFLRGCG